MEDGDSLSSSTCGIVRIVAGDDILDICAKVQTSFQSANLVEENLDWLSVKE